MDKAGNLEANRDWVERYFYKKSDINGFLVNFNDGLTAYGLTIYGPENAEITITEQNQQNPQSYIVKTNSQGSCQGLFFFHSGATVNFYISGAVVYTTTLNEYIDIIVINTSLWAKFNGYGVTLPFELNSDYTLTVEFSTSEARNQSVVGNSYGDSASLSHVTIYGSNFYIGGGHMSTDVIIASYTTGRHKAISNDSNDKNNLDDTYYNNYTPTSYSGIYYQIGTRGGVLNYYGYLKDYKLESKSSGDTICHIIPRMKGSNCILYDVINEVEYTATGLEPAYL